MHSAALSAFLVILSLIKGMWNSYTVLYFESHTLLLLQATIMYIM